MSHEDSAIMLIFGSANASFLKLTALI